MIEIRNVSKTYHMKEREIHAVEDVSLKIHDGEIYGVIGYSGAGKSTLVRCINFLEVPDSGTVAISGFDPITAVDGTLYQNHKRVSEKQLRQMRSHIGMIFQHFNLLDRSTVYENVAYSLKHTGRSREEIHQRVFELLDLVDLKDRASSYPSELSGGQKQRVAIARALANEPQILLSDEATSALDPDVTESILQLLKKLNEKLGLTIIMITHEMDVIKEVCSRVAVMENGKVVEEGSVYDIFSSPEASITKKFVASADGMQGLSTLIAHNSALVKEQLLLKLLFDDQSVNDAMISETTEKFDVKFNIILADVEWLQNKPLGRMAVTIRGQEKNVEDAIAYMKSKRVRVEVIQNG